MHFGKWSEVHKGSDYEVNSQEHESVEEITEHVSHILVLGLIAKHVQNGYIVLNIIVRKGVNGEQNEFKSELPCEDKGQKFLGV
jgi:hypothetical protein